MTVAKPVVDVVVVNWNTGSYLRDCLDSLAFTQRSQFQLGRVIVVDNASDDDSLERASDVDLPLQFIRNTWNRGFAAACNQGARKGSGDFVLFLNPDTRVSHDALDRTVSFMVDRANVTVGICGGRVVGDSGADEFSCARFPTLWMVVAKMTGLTLLFPQWIPRQRLDAADLQTSGVVDQVIGAYFFIRRDLFESLAGFDERFFIYLEEVDLAYRSRQLGHLSYFLRDVTIHHTGHVSSDQVRGKRLFYMLRGRSEYAHKHWPRWQAPLLGFLTVAVELPARWVLAALRGRRGDMRQVGEAARRYVHYLAVGRSRTSERSHRWLRR
jgi:N-acetylglucosaminyl-diphospho-decaprenol L-rhamnosyltransferase